LFFLSYRAKLRTDLDIVKNADSIEKVRALRSLKGLFFEIDEDKLSGSETLELAKAQISESTKKASLLESALVILSIVFLTTAIVLNYWPHPSRPTKASLDEFLQNAESETNIERLLAGWGRQWQT
jgi:preprotein translocase subunit SecG